MKSRICPADHNNHDNDGTTNLVRLAHAARGKCSAAMVSCDIDPECLDRIIR